MQSRCHIKYNLLPFPPRLRLRPRCRLSLSLSLPFYGTPLDFHGNRGTLTLGLAVARRFLRKLQAISVFSDCPLLPRKRGQPLSLSPLIVPPSRYTRPFPLSRSPYALSRTRLSLFLLHLFLGALSWRKVGREKMEEEREKKYITNVHSMYIRRF